MNQLHFLQDFLENTKHKSSKDFFLYLLLAFRPVTTLVCCIIFVITVSIPCVVLMSKSPHDSTVYNVSFALLTGIIASGFVSLIVEMANNYRHNHQRLLVLHEYLFAVAKYEKYVDWCLHGRKNEDCPGEFTARNMAVSELVLEVGPIIESAYKNGREFMSLKELRYVITVIEAASKIGELAESYASENLKDASGISLYANLKEPLKSKITDFAEYVGISIVDDHLMNVVADYILTNPEELSEYEQHELKYNLEQFDAGMKKLNSFVKLEPIYNNELIPFEKRFAKETRKKNKEFTKADEDLRQMLQQAVEDGSLTEEEYDEFLRLQEEIRNSDKIDFDSIFDRHDIDDDEAIDAEMEAAVKRQFAERQNKLKRIGQLVHKAEGRSLE